MNDVIELIQAELLFFFVIHILTNYKITYKFYLTLIIGTIIVGIASKYCDNDLINMSLSLFAHLVSASVGIKYDSYKTLLYTNVCCISFSSLIYSIVFFASASIRMRISSNRIIEHIVCFIIILIVVFIIRKRTISNAILEIKTMSSKIKGIILVFIWELIVIITGLSALFRLQLSLSFKIAISLILFFAILVSFVIVFLLISENLSNSYYSRYNKIMQDKVNDDAKHIEKIALASEDLRHLKHDIRNMIIGINTYLDANDIEGAKTYLNVLHERVTPSRKWIHTGNPFLDSLLLDKHDSITENNINIKFDGLMPIESLKPVDICIVFGNALDNAIEACVKLPANIEREITFSIKQHANVIFIKISNPIASPIKIHNNNIISTKSTRGHGIGIPSMRKIVEEYNGQLILKSDEVSFTIEMSFILEDIKDYINV